jgi:hypothetical protein
VLMDTQAVLISNPKTAYPELVETVRRRLAGYQTAQRFVMCTYNVHRDNLNEVRATPAATVAPAPHRHRAGSATPPAPRRQRRRVARPSALTAEARPQTRVAEPLVAEPLVAAPAPLACPSRLPLSPAPLACPPHRRACPAQASSITPGKRAPSVMNLDLSGWVSVSALVEKSKAFLRMVEP